MDATQLLRELVAYWDDEERTLSTLTQNSSIEDVNRVGNRLGLKGRELKSRVRAFLRDQ
jgi:hypothetical protein